MISDFDPTDLKSQDERLRQNRTVEQSRAARQDMDLKALLETDLGRRFVWRILSESAVLHSSFEPNAMTMAFKEGRKSLGYLLLGDIERVCPGLYLRMVEEARTHSAKRNHHE